MRKWFTSLVFPGVPEVIASFLLLHSMFISEDFPTLERPIKANSGNLCFGFSEILVLLPANDASEIFISLYDFNPAANIAISPELTEEKIFRQLLQCKKYLFQFIFYERKYAA